MQSGLQFYNVQAAGRTYFANLQGGPDDGRLASMLRLQQATDCTCSKGNNYIVYDLQTCLTCVTTIHKD